MIRYTGLAFRVSGNKRMNEATNHHDAVGFEEWVEYCFGQGPRDFEGEGLTPDEPDEVWVERESRFTIDGKTIARYLKRLFLGSGSLLLDKTDAKLAAGVRYIFGVGGAFFDHMTSECERSDGTRNPIATTEDVAAVFEAMPTLYREVFDRRCPANFHPEGNASNDADRLGTAVYMIWDMDQCIYCVSEGEPAAPDHPITAAGFAALATVLRECDSPACLYSALHGLGHLAQRGDWRNEEEAGDARQLLQRSVRIIDAFLQSRSAEVPKRIIEYARHARIGAVR